jgi:hypothetical protein
MIATAPRWPLSPASARPEQAPKARGDTAAPAASKVHWSWRYSDVVVHLVVTSLVAMIWNHTEDPVLTLYLGGCLVGLTYLGLMAFEMRRAPTIISPLSFYFFWYSIGLGPAAASVGARIANGDAIWLASFQIRPSEVVCGYLLFLVGSVAFHLGLQIIRPLTRQPRDTSSLSNAGSRRHIELLLIIWALGVLARLFGNDMTAVGAIFGILAWASNASLCAYCLSTSPTKPRLSWTVLIAGCLIEFACNLRSFSKAYIMYSFVPIIWTCVYFRSYRKWLIPMGVGLATFYLFIVAPVVSTARLERRLDEADTTVARLLRVFEQYTVAETKVGEQAEKFFERQFDPIPTGFIYGEVEKYGLRYGETMGYLAYAFIPRLFWPGKPAVTRGAWFTVYLGMASNEEDATTATGLTPAGELYWNFGLWGVIVGMTAVGSLVGLLWRIAGSMPHRDPLRMLLYFNAVIQVLNNDQAGVSIVGIVYRMLVLGSLIWLWDQGTRRIFERTRKVVGGASVGNGRRQIPGAGVGD